MDRNHIFCFYCSSILIMSSDESEYKNVNIAIQYQTQQEKLSRDRYSGLSNNKVSYMFSPMVY